VKAQAKAPEKQMVPHCMDIFGSLTAERKIVKERNRKKKEEEQLKNVSKAGKLQTN